jgi:hypothetical protein
MSPPIIVVINNHHFRRNVLRNWKYHRVSDMCIDLGAIEAYNSPAETASQGSLSQDLEKL